MASLFANNDASVDARSDPANAVLLSAQITTTPAFLQGRVIAASHLVAGLAAPFGPPLSGFTLDTTSPALTFVGISALTAIVTIAIHFNKAMRTSPGRPEPAAAGGC